MFELSPDLTVQDRKDCLDAAFAIAEKHKFTRRALYACVAISDRYLSQKSISSKADLQAVFVTCLYIGAKMEEVEFPCHKIYLTKTKVKLQVLVDLELDIMNSLGWQMNSVWPMTFFDIIAQGLELKQKAYSFAQYICETLFYEYKYLSLKPSLVAAAVLYLVLKAFNNQSWNRELQERSTYPKQEVVQTALFLAEVLEDFWKNDVNLQTGLSQRFLDKAYSAVAEYRFLMVDLSSRTQDKYQS